MQLKKFKIKFIYNIMYIVIFSVGIIAGFFILLWLMRIDFVFSKEVGLQFDIVALISLMVTVFLAIYVTKILQSNNEQRRVEKKMLIESFEELKKTFCNDIKIIISTANINYTDVVSKLKIFKMDFGCIVGTTKSCNFNLEGIDRVIYRSYKKIQDLLTATPSVGDEIVVKNGKLTYNIIQVEKIYKELNTFKLNMFELIVRINRGT